MSVVEVNQANFKAEVLESPIPVLADFNADWCGPCKAIRPMLEELAESGPSYKIVSIDIDAESDLAEEYDVTSIPCLVLFKDGQEANRSIGLISKDAIAQLAEG